MHGQLKNRGSSLKVCKGSPIEVWKQIIREHDIGTVYTNRDYEPYAISRDAAVEELLAENGISFKSFKDQVIFEGMRF